MKIKTEKELKMKTENDRPKIGLSGPIFLLQVGPYLHLSMGQVSLPD